GLAAPPATLHSRLLGSRERDRLAAQLARGRFLSAQRADLHTLGGLLLPEKGEPADARQQFELAASIYQREKGVAPAVPGQALTTRYIQTIKAAKPR
ncbi:MAG TPA: hypothetical protein VMZ71_16130, partial [Gemmataceae bacterium]|nr:hypothetical protein [Gemmataceae bacterium]